MSSASLNSGWVNSELDVANELKAQGAIKKFFVFQLDETHWSELPEWMRRYVVSCPPSPSHVALRLRDELDRAVEKYSECYGRSEDEKNIINRILESERVPAFLYLSGPIGIGRRSLACAVYKTYYREVSGHKIQIAIDSMDDIGDIYRKTLGYGANWRASEFRAALDEFFVLPKQKQIKVLAEHLERISVEFRQVIVINLGIAGLTDEGRPQSWFYELAKNLPSRDYPYIWFLSQRFLSGIDIANGVFYQLEPLDDEWSKYSVFNSKLLLTKTPRNGLYNQSRRPP